jgi:hypothetical protein
MEKSFLSITKFLTLAKLEQSGQRRAANKEATMPDLQTAFPRKGGKDGKMAKRKSSEFKDSKESVFGASKHSKAPKKRKLDQIQHIPTLVSSTFNPLEEVDFPRGTSALTPLERKQAENEGMQDALFEVATANDDVADLYLGSRGGRHWKKEQEGKEVEAEQGVRDGGSPPIRWPQN